MKSLRQPEPMSAESDIDESAWVERVRVETLYRFNTGGSALTVLLGPLTAWRLGESAQPGPFWYWCIVLVGIAMLRGLLGLAFYRSRQRLSDANWHHLLIVTAVLVGFCWGSLTLPVFSVPPDARLLITALVMAVTGIGMITYMVSSGAFMAFALPVMACMIISTTTRQTAMHFDASLIVCFFSAIMLIGSRRVSAQFEEMSRARWFEALMRAKADQANAAKSRFLAAMSHELRTPVNGITGMAEMLRSARLEAPFDRYLDAMQKACQHLVGVVDDVIDFARINARNLKIEPRGFELRSALNQALTPLELIARQRGLVLTWEVEPELPEWIYGDDQRLIQILTNLVSNAIKFTPQGSVLVKAGLLAGDRWQLSVTDSGIGINPEKQTEIFEPFVQADASMARRYGGSGLGLSICRELVSLMGGEIEVRSALGRGSSFAVRLALQPAEPPARSEKQGNLTLPEVEVLIVEDDEDSREIIVYYLQKLGLHVRSAANGLEAIEAYLTRVPDLILMDCQMPEMDGLTATRKLREMGSRTPILALTAHALPEQIRSCDEAGMNEVMTKPIDIDSLGKVLSRHLPGVPAPNSPM